MSREFVETIAEARIRLNSASQRLAARESERKVTVRMRAPEAAAWQALCAVERKS